MRLSSVVLVVAGLVAAGGCAGNKCRGLDRPADLGDEWVWGAEALPTGDVGTSNITIEKFMPARVLPDSVFAYTVRVTNVSKRQLDNVAISDTVPSSGYTLISTEPEAVRSGSSLRWPVGAMGPGQSYTVIVTGHLEAGYRASTCATVAYVAPPAGPTPEQVAAEKAAADKKSAEKAAADKAAADKAAAEKKAAADKAAADKATAEKAAAAAAAAAATKAAADKAAADKAAADKAAAEKAAAAPAKLELTMTMPPEACAFDGVPFKMLLRNTGKTKATDVRVVDQFPEGMTVNGKKYVAFQVGELAPGAGREFSVRMTASKAGKFKNSATVTGAGGLKAEASGETNVWKAVLGVTNKPGADSFGLGKDATFTFTVSNTSDRPAAETQLRVTMTGADSVKGADNGGTVSGTTVTWKLGDLAKGASKTVTVKAVRAKAGTVDCSATASSKCSDPVTAASKGAYK